MGHTFNREKQVVARILKVNHAGEHGAIRIYRAQIAIARWRCPDAIAMLQEMLSHEVSHHDRFAAAMPDRQARPCRALFLWAWGGWWLGLLTALAGRSGIWACTAAVEETVHRHLEEQIHFLRNRDTELHDLVLSIKVEELAHLDHAIGQLEERSAAVAALRAAVGWVTDGLIFLSTLGDSLRLARALRRYRS